MRYLTLSEILALYHQLIHLTGGTEGIRDLGGLESAVAMPQMTFDDVALYPSVAEKASALAYSLIMNHPFIDGNKRIGHAAMEVFLLLNGFELDASIDEQEDIILRLAAGAFPRDQFTRWVSDHLVER